MHRARTGSLRGMRRGAIAYKSRGRPSHPPRALRDRGSDEIEGVSLAKVLAGQAEAARDAIFAEESTMPRDAMRCVRTARFKLLRNMPSAADDTEFADRPTFELYDLERDPHELADLSGDPEYRTIETDLLRRLESWLQGFPDPHERPHEEAERLEQFGGFAPIAAELRAEPPLPIGTRRLSR
jgi:hypothetical protein